jgi:alanyl-tRNA synthetase
MCISTGILVGSGLGLKATEPVVNKAIPTIKHYFDSDELEMYAQVTACMEQDEQIAIVLDGTLFHPKGGGQPADIGHIGGVKVHDVTSRDDVILHWVHAPIPLHHTLIHVDENVRHQHARLHSAGHLLGNAGQSLGWRPTKAHHWPNECKVIFDLSDAITDPAPQESWMAQPNDQLETWIAHDLPRSVIHHRGTRTVAYGNLDAFPCGGTHVISTATIGAIHLKAIKLKGRQVTVSYS